MQDLLAAYIATEVHFLDADAVTCRTGATGDTPGFGKRTDLVAAVDSSYVDAWVITAENPYGRQTNPEANRAFTAALGWDIVLAGFTCDTVECSSPSGDWSETSFLIFGKTDNHSAELASLVLRLARKYEQNAVFHFINGKQVVVPVLDPRFHGSREYTIEYSNQGGVRV
jgi:hypothetical protein